MTQGDDPAAARKRGASLTVQLGGERYLVTSAPGGRIEIDGVPEAFHVTRLGQADYGVRQGEGPTFVVMVAQDNDVTWVFVDGETYELAVSRGSSPPRIKRRTIEEDLTAPMPATVATIAVQPGDEVHRGDTLLVLEAMKMELPLRAPADGRVRAVLCREGDQVQPGVPLVELAGPDDS